MPASSQASTAVAAAAELAEIAPSATEAGYRSANEVLQIALIPSAMTQGEHGAPVRPSAAGVRRHEEPRATRVPPPLRRLRWACARMAGAAPCLGSCACLGRTLNSCALCLAVAAVPPPAPLDSAMGDHGQRHVGLGAGRPARGTDNDAFAAFRNRSAARYQESLAITKSQLYTSR